VWGLSLYYDSRDGGGGVLKKFVFNHWLSLKITFPCALSGVFSKFARCLWASRFAACCWLWHGRFGIHTQCDWFVGAIFGIQGCSKMRYHHHKTIPELVDRRLVASWDFSRVFMIGKWAFCFVGSPLCLCVWLCMCVLTIGFFLLPTCSRNTTNLHQVISYCTRQCLSGNKIIHLFFSHPTQMWCLCLRLRV
jgi:hypothetical protein